MTPPLPQLLLPLLLLFLPTTALTPTSPLTLNTFDGPGFPSCLTPISQIHTPPSIPALASLIRTAAAAGHRVRAAGAGHSWYDTQCSASTSVPTVILRTDALTAITDLVLPGGGGESKGSVVVEAGVTFFQLAAYLHERGASVGYALTNWNITFGGAVAMGAHRWYVWLLAFQSLCGGLGWGGLRLWLSWGGEDGGDGGLVC